GATSTASTTASIAWTTDEAATSTVQYGLTTSYGSTATSSGTTTHSVALSGLATSTTYHYRIVATDASLNTSSTTDVTFVTTAPADTTAPIITAGATSTATTTASIAWTTNEAATSTIQYGLTTSYGLTATSSGTTTHSAALTGLASTTLYHYMLTARDASGNTSTSSDATFTTLDGTAPTVSSASSTAVSSSTATITWTTNENSTSVVNYGLTTGYGTASSSATLTTSHTVFLTGLSTSTLYHFQVVSVDAVGNSTSSADLSFTTYGVPDTTPPIISSISSSTTAYTALVGWNTNELALPQVDYGLTTSYGSATSSGVLAFVHSLGISGLLPSTLYHFKITAQDGSGNTATSADKTFLTAPDITAPVVSSVVVSPTTSGANITWITNENASSSVMYGDTSAYGTTSTSSSNTSHNVTITGLSEGLLQHYTIYARDLYGNVSTTTDGTFTTSVTAPAAPASPAPVGPLGGNGGGSGGVIINTPPVAVDPTPVPGCPAGFVCVPNPNNPAAAQPHPSAPVVGGIIGSGFSIKNITSQGKKSPDVIIIQKLLNSDPATRIAPSGPGSPGKETNLFGIATKAAVIKFQLKYGIVKSPRDQGYGVVGPKTKAKMNELLRK
ncbi:MAG: hypothetical protein RJB39_338, partial [Candidatus Parcubacteria bacterium]